MPHCLMVVIWNMEAQDQLWIVYHRIRPSISHDFTRGLDFGERDNPHTMPVQY
jgi:hypothetical protein